jgi:alpha/beta hydrolase fold
MNLLRPNERDVTVNGLKLRVLDWGGEGRPHLLLLHGFTGHAHAWDTLAIALQPHFHVWALDQRGHGDSDPADVYGPVAAFGDITGVVDQLTLAPLVLVGVHGWTQRHVLRRQASGRGAEARRRGHRSGDQQEVDSASSPVADGSIALLLDPLAYQGLLARVLARESSCPPALSVNRASASGGRRT